MSINTLFEQVQLGQRHYMRVPVQYGKWSHSPRVCIVVRIDEDPSGKIIVFKIQKGQKGAGRRFCLQKRMDGNVYKIPLYPQIGA